MRALTRLTRVGAATPEAAAMFVAPVPVRVSNDTPNDLANRTNASGEPFTVIDTYDILCFHYSSCEARWRTIGRANLRRVRHRF